VLASPLRSTSPGIVERGDASRNHPLSSVYRRRGAFSSAWARALAPVSLPRDVAMDRPTQSQSIFWHVTGGARAA
jgi:hypothetical protein